VTTRANTKAAPNDESLVEVEFMLAEPSDVRLHGRQITAVKLEVKLSVSLVT
jgi:hypothetical protein